MRQIKLGEEQQPKKKLMKIVKSIAIIFLAIFFLEVLMVNRLSTYGNKIQKLKEAKVNLQLENQILENQISQKVSLLSIEKRAASYGFHSVRNIEYLKDINLASAQ